MRAGQDADQAPTPRMTASDLLASSVGLWRWDLDQQRVYGDSRFAELYGLGRVDAARGVPAETFFASIHPDDRMRLRIAVAGVMHGVESLSREYRLPAKNGGFRWVM